MMIFKIDLQGKSMKERERVLRKWFNRHLHCIDGVGHYWACHYWIPELKAWLWGPCRKCGMYRVTQVYGNYISWNPDHDYARALVVNDNFGDLDVVLGKLVSALTAHTDPRR